MKLLMMLKNLLAILFLILDYDPWRDFSVTFKVNFKISFSVKFNDQNPIQFGSVSIL